MSADIHIEDAEDEFKNQKAESMRLEMAKLMLGPSKLSDDEALAKVQSIDANRAAARGQPGLHVEDEDSEQFFAPGCEYPEMPKDEKLQRQIYAVQAKLTEKFDDDQVVPS
jgi:hypothetical protein